MSKITLIDNAGNTLDVALPDTVTLTIAAPTPIAPPAAPLVAAFSIVVTAGNVVTVTDASTGALPTDTASFTWANGTATTCPLGGSVSHLYPNASQYMITETITRADGTTATCQHAVHPGTTTPPVGSTPPSNQPPTDPPADPPPSDPPATPPVAATRQAFTAAQLHWRDTESRDTVDVAITLIDGTPLHLASAPLGLTPMQNADGSPHDHLAVARYKDGVVVENCWMDATQNLAGSLVVDVNGTNVFTQDAVQFWFSSRTVPIRTGLPQYTPVQPDPALLPNYGNPGPLTSQSKKMGADEAGINGRGYAQYVNMGSPGGRSDIGLIPGWDLPWACQGLYWQDCRDANDHSTVQPMHVRDPATGMPVDPTQQPTASLVDTLLGYHFSGHGTNPIVCKTSCPYTPSSSHQTHFGVVPYLSTMNDFDMEEVAFWGSYQGIFGNPVYRQFETGLALAQGCRGLAWSLAQYGYTAKLLPNGHPLKASFTTMLDNSLQHWWTETYAPGMPRHNLFGVFWDFEYQDAQKRYRGASPWQNHYLASALHLLVEYGFDGWTDFRNFSAQFAVDSMQKMCGQLATVFNMFFIPAATYTAKNIGPLWTSWAEVEADTLATAYAGKYADQAAVPCGQMVLNAGLGLMSGATGGCQSYPAMIQPALAAAVDAGLSGAADAWAFHQARCGAIDYTKSNEKNIVPRAST